MQRGVKESVSVWAEKEKTEPSFSSLSKGTTADVCIVGAGIAGLTAAYLLQKQGKPVVVIDAWGFAAGETSRTTAHLTAVLDNRYFRLQELFGTDNARLIAESHMAAINRIEAIVKQEKIDCDFERLDGYLIASAPEHRDHLEKEIEAAKRAGLSDLEFLKEANIQGSNLKG